MALEFFLDRDQGCVSVNLSGNLTLSPQLSKFAGHVTALFSTRGVTGVLLDLSKVDGLDSAGLGELVILYTAAGEANCALCLVQPAERGLLLLAMTRLAELFPQFGDEESAKKWLRSLAP